ncbi:PIN domain-containing protein [Gordonia sp. ABSL11-1]|uniref:type II toxin-antitoxin system VapC family toxin n=1 Tax=Gordonia sp. ABSL11-1 TaxID=3053924 RepID=UPI002573FF95|nr:PIN domain-containing protein [Gordonia sp. ABSL11-1]MDL9945801.1 PIN domain-containing protein [Gordonia sp. ABSL11-1]
MILIDTGVLVALVNGRDVNHQVCTEWFLSSAIADLLIPSPLISEICYMVALRGGPNAEHLLLLDLAEGLYGQVVEVTHQDLQRMAELVDQYADLPLGGADASIIAIAERLGITEVATVDRRRFSVVRPHHTGALTLLPQQLSSSG